MSILKELKELTTSGIISSEIAQSIKNYYENKEEERKINPLVVFGVLGGVLVGLGTILLIAHNWDELPIVFKTMLSFFPLLTSQALCVFSLLRRKNNPTWSETSAVLLVFSVGASMSLVSQTYNIEGDLKVFLLSWLLLIAPLMFLMPSSVASLLYWFGLTWYASLLHGQEYSYWLLSVPALGYYYWLYKNKSGSLFLPAHHWTVVFSLFFGITFTKMSDLVLLTLMSFFGLLSLIGQTDFFAHQPLRNNAYRVGGTSATLCLLFGLSFYTQWDITPLHGLALFQSTDFWLALLFTALAIFVLSKNIAKKQTTPIDFVFLAFIPIFFIAISNHILAKILINLLVLGIGLWYLREGNAKQHAGILNFGLSVISLLIICRFFDTDIDFLLRGLLFIGIGVAFFLANYYLIKNKKTPKKNEKI